MQRSDISPIRFFDGYCETTYQLRGRTQEERLRIDWRWPEDIALRQAKYLKGKDGRYYSFNNLEWFAKAGDEFVPGYPFPYSIRSIVMKREYRFADMFSIWIGFD
jgi:hypothetical protein